MSNERPQNGVFIVLGAIALILAVVWFIVRRPTQIADFPPPDSDPSAAQATDKVTINFYLDGSGSIKHFLLAPTTVNGRPSTNYMKNFLDKCGSTLVNGWKNTNFFSFGGGMVEPIKSDDAAKDAQAVPAEAGTPSTLGADPRNMEIHPEWFNAERTAIEVPIKHHLANSGKDDKEVKIIVTDLFESKGSMELPTNALAGKYLSPEKDPHNENAVDILAVRNPTDGEVEDMPGAGKNVLKHAANTMPFYIIVAGPTVYVRSVMKALIEGIPELGDAKTAGLTAEFFFSRTPPPYYRGTMTPTPDTGASPAKLVLIDPSYRNLGIPLLELKGGIVELSWPEPEKPSEELQKLYGTPALKAKVLSPSAIAGAPPAKSDAPAASSDSPVSDNKWQEDTVAEAAIGECASPSLVCKRIDWSKLPPNTKTYVLRFDRIAKDKPRVFEPYSSEMRKWNIEGPAAEIISQSKVPQFPNDEDAGVKAGKTPDLSKFLKGLQQQTYNAQLTMMTYYVYLQTN